MLHEYDDALHHRKTTLATAPTLLVLHELSAYFTSQATQATYAYSEQTAIVHFLSNSQRLGLSLRSILRTGTYGLVVAEMASSANLSALGDHHD